MASISMREAKEVTIGAGDKAGNVSGLLLAPRDSKAFLCWPTRRRGHAA
jgi:hypothetical protein